MAERLGIGTKLTIFSTVAPVIGWTIWAIWYGSQFYNSTLENFTWIKRSVVENRKEIEDLKSRVAIMEALQEDHERKITTLVQAKKDRKTR